MRLLMRTVCNRQNEVSTLASGKETGPPGSERCPPKGWIPSQSKHTAASSVICCSAQSLFKYHICCPLMCVFHILSWSSCSLSWESMACWWSTRICFLMRESWGCCRPQYSLLTGAILDVNTRHCLFYSWFMGWVGIECTILSASSCWEIS